MKSNAVKMSGASSIFAHDDSEATLWQKLHDLFASRIGATNMLYGFTHSVHLTDRVGFTKSLFIKHSYDEAYVAALDGHLLEDEIGTAVLYEANGPFLWDDLCKIPDLTEKQLKRSKLDEKFKLNVGVSLAFRFAQGRGISGVGLASCGMSPDEFAKRWHANESEHIAILTEFDSMMRPAMVRNRLVLTKREAQCLKLSVGGMSAKEIGHHLSLHQKSVFNILDRARKALDAGNTIEAVAKALAYDLI